MSEQGSSSGVGQAVILTLLGVIFSVGVAYATLGGDIKANAKAIDGLSQAVSNIAGIQVNHARMDEVQKAQAKDIARILRILERKYGVGAGG